MGRESGKGAPGMSRPSAPVNASNMARLLDRLQCVRQVGLGKFVSRCPAHEDVTPSLSIRQLDDGRILVHDFGGCDIEQVLSAVGLTLGDLYPERSTHHRAPVRAAHRHAANEALRVVDREARIIVVAAENMAQDVVLEQADSRRVLTAAMRIRAALEVAG